MSSNDPLAQANFGRLDEYLRSQFAAPAPEKPTLSVPKYFSETPTGTPSLESIIGATPSLPANYAPENIRPVAAPQVEPTAPAPSFLGGIAQAAQQVGNVVGGAVSEAEKQLANAPFGIGTTLQAGGNLLGNVGGALETYNREVVNPIGGYVVGGMHQFEQSQQQNPTAVAASPTLYSAEALGGALQKAGETALGAIQKGQNPLEALQAKGKEQFATGTIPEQLISSVVSDPANLLGFANVGELAGGIQKAKAAIEAAAPLTEVAGRVEQLPFIERMALKAFKPLEAGAGELKTVAELGAPIAKESNLARRIVTPLAQTPASKLTVYGQKIIDNLMVYATDTFNGFGDMATYLRSAGQASAEGSTKLLAKAFEAHPELNSATGQRLIRGMEGVGYVVDKAEKEYKIGQGLINELRNLTEHAQDPEKAVELFRSNKFINEETAKMPAGLADVFESFKQGRLTLDQVPAAYDQAAKLRLANSVAEHALANLAHTAGIPLPNPVTRLLQQMRAYESLFFLGLNPHALVQNPVNNFVRLALYSINPAEGAGEVARMFKRIGYTPSFDFGTVASKIIKEAVPNAPFGAAVPKWVQEFPIAKQGFALWQKTEQASRERAFLKGWTQTYNQLWRAGTAFKYAREIPQFAPLEATIREVAGEQGVKQFYAAMEQAHTVQEAQNAAHTFLSQPRYSAYLDEMAVAVSQRLTALARANGRADAAINVGRDQLESWLSWGSREELNRTIAEAMQSHLAGESFDVAWNKAVEAQSQRAFDAMMTGERDAAKIAPKTIETGMPKETPAPSGEPPLASEQGAAPLVGDAGTQPIATPIAAQTYADKAAKLEQLLGRPLTESDHFALAAGDTPEQIAARMGKPELTAGAVTPPPTKLGQAKPSPTAPAQLPTPEPITYQHPPELVDALTRDGRYTPAQVATWTPEEAARIAAEENLKVVRTAPVSLEELRQFAAQRLQPGVGTISERGATYDSHLLDVLNNHRPYGAEAFTAEQLASNPARRLEAWNILSEYVPRELRTYPTLAREQFVQQARQSFRNLSDKQFNDAMSVIDARAQTWAKERGRTAEDFYNQYFAGVESGKAGAGGLKQTEKGATEFLKDGRAIIRAMETHDVSTLVHEAAHTFIRTLSPEDLATVEKWTGLNPGEFALTHGRLYTTKEINLASREGIRYKKAQEQFAQGFEKYLSEGIAPTEALKSVFANFRDWLLSIYRNIRGGALDVKLTDETRALFGRMLDSESVIDAGELRKIEAQIQKAARAEAVGQLPHLETKYFDQFFKTGTVEGKDVWLSRNPIPGKPAWYPIGNPRQKALDGFPPFRLQPPAPRGEWIKVPGHEVRGWQDAVLQHYGQNGLKGILPENANIDDLLSAVSENRNYNAPESALYQRGGAPKLPKARPGQMDMFAQGAAANQDLPIVSGVAPTAKVEPFKPQEVVKQGELAGFEKPKPTFPTEPRAVSAQAATVVSEELKQQYPNLYREVQSAPSFDAMMNKPPDYLSVGGATVEGISDPKTYKDLTLQELYDLRAENPKALVSGKFWTARRGGAARRKFGVGKLDLPPDPQEFYQATHRAAMEEAAPSDPNLLFQTIHDASPLDSRAHAQAEQAMTGELLRAIQPLLARDAANAGKLLPKEAQALAAQYIARELAPNMAQAKLAANAVGRHYIERTIMSYLHRYNLDDSIANVAPFMYWPVHMTGNVALDFIDHPQWAAYYLRLREAIQKTTDSPDFPARFKGKLRIGVPFLDSVAPWLGGGVYFDPLSGLYPIPPGDYLKRAQMAQSNLPNTRDAVLNMVTRGEISQEDAQNAIANHSGAIWDRAQAEAASNAPDAGSVMDSLLSYHLPIQAAIDLLTGNAGDIGNTLANVPAARIFNAVAKPLGGGIPTQWDNYYTLRALASLKDENKISEDAYQRAIMTQTGAAWDLAKQRAGIENFTVPALTSFTGFTGKVYTSGEHQYYLSKLQRDNLMNQEIARLGGNPLMLQDQKYDFLKAHGAYAGDSPLNQFANAHPELGAFSDIHKDPEQLFKTYLIDAIWNRYINEPELQQKLDRAQLGDAFNQLFINKTTRNYSKIDLALVEGWANALKIGIPKPAEFSAPTPAPFATTFATEAQNKAYQRFYDGFEQSIGWAKYAQGWNAYHQLTDKAQKAAFLKDNPYLTIGLQESDKFFRANPDIQKLLEQSGAKAPSTAQEDVSQGKAFSQAVIAAGLDWNQISAWKQEYDALPQGTGARTRYLSEHPEYLRYLTLARAFYGNKPQTGYGTARSGGGYTPSFTWQEKQQEIARKAQQPPRRAGGKLRSSRPPEARPLLNAYYAMLRLPRFAARAQAQKRGGARQGFGRGGLPRYIGTRYG